MNIDYQINVLGLISLALTIIIVIPITIYNFIATRKNRKIAEENPIFDWRLSVEDNKLKIANKGRDKAFSVYLQGDISGDTYDYLSEEYIPFEQKNLNVHFKNFGKNTQEDKTEALPVISSFLNYLPTFQERLIARVRIKQDSIKKAEEKQRKEEEERRNKFTPLSGISALIGDLPDMVSPLSHSADFNQPLLNTNELTFKGLIVAKMYKGSNKEYSQSVELSIVDIDDQIRDLWEKFKDKI